MSSPKFHNSTKKAKSDQLENPKSVLETEKIADLNTENKIQNKTNSTETEKTENLGVLENPESEIKNSLSKVKTEKNEQKTDLENENSQNGAEKKVENEKENMQENSINSKENSQVISDSISQNSISQNPISQNISSVEPKTENPNSNSNSNLFPNNSKDLQPKVFFVAILSVLTLLFLLLIIQTLIRTPNSFLGKIYQNQNLNNYINSQSFQNSSSRSRNFMPCLPRAEDLNTNNGSKSMDNCLKSESFKNWQNSVSNSNFNFNSASNSANSQNSAISVQFDRLEYAKTESEKAKGLMFRKDLCDKCGMWFEFESEDYRRFWMKNTWVDLDIIFVDSNGEIVNIAAAKSEKIVRTNDDYPGYTSLKPAKFVLEIPQGNAKKLNLETGKKLNLENLQKQLIPFENVPVPLGL